METNNITLYKLMNKSIYESDQPRQFLATDPLAFDLSGC